MTKGLLCLSDYVEDGEALFTAALLRRAGIQVDTVTFKNEKSILTSYGFTVQVDFLSNQINPKDYNFLVIPGGRYVALNVDKDIEIKKLSTSFYDQKKLIAAICAGPRFLGQIGLLDHKEFTCFPGCEKDMPKGIYLKDQKVVNSQQIITARSAGAVYEFAYEIVKHLLGEDQAMSLYESIIY